MCPIIKDRLSHIITAHNILKNEIDLTMPQIPRKQNVESSPP